ncbi:MAG: TetM/TetW/TetO/TetS family tetracycline resistance ribosomal protection protein [Eubacteriales bacterium]|nr:TetM/TetW/TetO/TetS family tetracycline resistance ribosomal protection protein [Eubacteriales bacterium]
MKRITIGILANVDSGKTTLSEAMLYETGAIRKPGRVDHGDSFLDTDAIERSRGITIFSKQAMLSWNDMSVTLLDTPGHMDFAAEAERTIAVLDYAVLVISSVDGIRSHTETIWKMLRKSHVPTFIYVNKMDLEVREREDVLEVIREGLAPGAVDFSAKRSRDAYLDDLTMASEDLTEKLLENGDVTKDDIAKAVKAEEVYPCYFGSALKMEGVKELLRGLEDYTLEAAPREGFGARVFKIVHDGKERLTFMRLTGGELHARDLLEGTGRDGAEWSEKASQLRIYSGDKYKLTDKAGPGQVVAVTGLTHTTPGDGLGLEENAAKTLEPYMSYMVIPGEGANSKAVLDALRQLGEEDPELNVTWDAGNEEISVSLMGQIQLEIISKIMKDRFGLDISFGSRKVIYRETIGNTVEGIAHFEPIRHYAEVHVIMEPGERGSGIVVSSACPYEILDADTQKKILRDLTDKRHIGVLTGSLLTDVSIKLVSGVTGKHTEPPDFNEAASRAVRNGLMNAENILLEPWAAFKIKAATSYSGKIMTDISGMGGKVEDTEAQADGSTEISGKAPAASVSEYLNDLPGMIGDNISVSMENAGYDVCHDADRVIEEAGYDPEADIDETPDSVFFVHGKSLLVKWDAIDEYIKAPRVLKDREQGFDQEAFEENMRRESEFKKKLAGDDELMAIFESTYGKIKKRGAKRSSGYEDSDYAEDQTWNAGKSRDGKAGSALLNEEKEARKNKKKPDGKRETYVFIDGYNLMHSWSEMEELSRDSYGAARDELVDRVCNYQGYTGYNVTVVFDGYKNKDGAGSREKRCGVDIVYTMHDQTADAYIEKATHDVLPGTGKKASKPVVKVVTSDAMVQSMALGHGALRVSSHEFVKELESVENTIFGYEFSRNDR